MSSKKEKSGSDKRRFPRFPVVEGMIEPINVLFGDEAVSAKTAAAVAEKGQPAILTNLSAGGMSLLMFLEPPHARKFDMVLSLPGLSHVPIEAKVVRVLPKGQTYNVGIEFTKISKKHQNLILSMSQDHLDCETRIMLKLPEVCVKTCTFNALCGKPQKGPYWPKK